MHIKILCKKTYAMWEYVKHTYLSYTGSRNIDYLSPEFQYQLRSHGEIYLK